ncbi:hypothetical protein CGLO_14396 [Colletotrichum gloeosporioides Cg-14]|uniref:Uncharacterized protein n=1 Tax=Colletotrichum gloeosporioides (strain Cg-14) TaxID=1237896 RepID=T0K1D9_COLGC|nr:hypothetical protein CGLO_14396 [Colletotrichum gloeosporioides Cg-14]
MIKKAGTSSV